MINITNEINLKEAFGGTSVLEQCNSSGASSVTNNTTASASKGVVFVKSTSTSITVTSNCADARAADRAARKQAHNLPQGT